MGLAEIIKTVKTYIENRNGGPGVTLYLEGTGVGGLGVNAELYQAPGIMSRPPKGTRGVFIPIGKGRRYGVVVAMHNYSVIVSGNEGDTTIFSTASDGKTVKARVELDNAGKVKISNATKSLKAILDGIIDHLSSLTTINCVSGAPVALSPATIAQLAQDKASLAALLKD
jgi:hypothetical protein